MRVDLLVLDGVFDLGLSALLDTFSVANDLSAREGGRPPFEVLVIGTRARVMTHHGLRVPVQRPGPKPDVVIVPAMGCKTPETIAAALERPDARDAYALLVERAEAGVRTMAACTGTFVLAESSLLDGGEATTTWWLAPMFRARFPQITLDDSRMVVESGACVTAGAALAHLDLALYLVRAVSPTLASTTSRYLLVDARPTPALYAIPDHLSHNDPIVERFERFMRRELGSPFDLTAAARAAGTSERTLARRIRHTLGKTPLGYVQDLRVEHAIHRLRTSDASVDEIATEVGYTEGVTLRNLLRRKTGRGIRELRRV